MAAIKRKADVNMKPEFVVSSGYDPIKSEEETDDEDIHKDTNTSNSHENYLPINTEAVKVEVKAEEYDISTDDEYAPESLVSWLIGYDPVKSEETDSEELDEDTITSNENHTLKVKAEVKTEDDVSTDDENGSEMEIPGKHPGKSPRSSVDFTIQSNASIREVQSTTKKKRYCRKRKRKVKEVSNAVQKTVCIECSVEGCTGKAADSGTCKRKHKGYNYCSQEGCTNKRVQGGVCQRHGAVVKPRKTCSRMHKYCCQ